MEKNLSLKREVYKNPIESEANYEGNMTLLLIERVRVPAINEQIVEILFKEEIDQFNFYNSGEWVRFIPEGWSGDEERKLFRNTLTEEVISWEELEENRNLLPPSIENVREALNDRILQVENSTPISFDIHAPNEEVVTLNWDDPISNKKPDQKMMSYIEAHEKGHILRPYRMPLKKYESAFDINQVKFSNEFYEILIKENLKHGEVIREEKQSFEEAREEYLYGYLFNPREVAERMSQLKNYFGFDSDKEFTKEHLYYAKENFVKDTGVDNAMTMFLQAITDETEDEFIKLINSWGNLGLVKTTTPHISKHPNRF